MRSPLMAILKSAILVYLKSLADGAKNKNQAPLPPPGLPLGPCVNALPYPGTVSDKTPPQPGSAANNI